MQWGDILTDLYADMKDPAGTKLPLDRAFLYLKFALRDYSGWNPRLLSGSLDVDTSGVAALPDDFIRMAEVRDSASGELVNPLRGVFNPPSFTLSLSDIRWWVEGSNLRLTSFSNVPPALSILYQGLHALPAAASSTSFEMTFPDADEEAILLYIRGKEAGSTRTKTSMIDRYKRRTDAGNTRTDNPLRPEENNLMDEYLAFVSQRYGTGGVRLSRRR
jgi:hypothetical protein